MTPIQQASYQSRRLKTIARQMTDMAADWGDVDNYFLQQMESLSSSVKEVQEMMTEYVEEAKQQK